MEKVIGREEEKEVLDELMRSNEAELLAIYGRRRIGKTYLIQQYFKDKTVFFSMAGISGGDKRTQLRNFPKALEEAFGLTKRPPVPLDWFEVFDQLEQQIKNYTGNKKIVLFFDELPWLAGNRPFMLRALEHSWNRTLSQLDNVIMVLCGSAAAWIIKKIIRNTKGLYGRITQKIHLQPFTLKETALYLKSRNVELDYLQLMNLFMVTGGVAKYLKLVKPGNSAAETVQQLCFNHNGFLYSEFDELFHSLFNNPEKHLQIIKALGSSHYGLTNKELSSLTGLPSGGSLKRSLDDLEASGFVTTLPFYGRKKQEAKYRVIDEYTLFYIRWIKPADFVNSKTVTPDYWHSIQNTQSFKSWRGYAFENLCLKHISFIVNQLHLGAVIRKVSYWDKHGKKCLGEEGAQIDLILERRDRSVNLCEIKFSDEPYIMTQDYAKKINHRKELFIRTTKFKGTVFNTLITPHKCEKNPAYLASIAKQVSLNALF